MVLGGWYCMGTIQRGTTMEVTNEPAIQLAPFTETNAARALQADIDATEELVADLEGAVAEANDVRQASIAAYCTAVERVTTGRQRLAALKLALSAIEEQVGKEQPVDERDD